MNNPMIKKIENIEQFKNLLEGRNGLTQEEKKMILEKFVDKTLHTPEEEAQVQKGTHDFVKRISTNAPFAEMIRKSKIKQHPDLVLLATYDLIVNKDYESVTTADIMGQYKSAVVQPSANTSADIRQNKMKGYMMSVDKKDGKMAFKITMSGTDYIEGVLKNAE